MARTANVFARVEPEVKERAEQVTLTTNGVLLEKQAGALKRAGVDCINVSLDTLDPRLYRQITGQDALEKVVAGILQAEKLDIPVHANTVLPKSINDAVWQQVLSCNSVVVKPSPRIHLDFLKAWLD